MNIYSVAKERSKTGRLWIVWTSLLIMLTANVGIAQAAQTRYFYDNFENGLTFWEVSGQDWALITDTYRSEGHCITDSPDGNYPARSYSSATLAYSINLSKSTQPILTFWQKRFLYYSTSTNHDSVYVDVSQDNGVSWTKIYETYNTSSSWSQMRLDLSAYKAKPVMIRFRMGGTTGGKDGWYIDDVEIKEKDTSSLACPFFDDFEHGLDNWEVGGQEWQLVETEYRSAGHSITDSPEGNYPSRSFSEAILAHPIDLSATSNPILTFWQKRFLYYSTSTSHDDVWVDVSRDGGVTWTNVYESYNTSSSWAQARVDLSAYKETPVLIRFRLGGYTGGKDGWYIDDVEIKEKDTTTLAFPFFDDFESGLDNWEVGGQEWHLVETDYRSAGHSITDSPAGNYPYHSYSTAVLAHPIDLSATSSPILKFWHKRFLYYSTSTNHDSIYVDISPDGGVNWTKVYEANNTSSCWTLERVDLSAYKETPVLIRFRMGGYTGGKDGWYIDDVEIREKYIGTTDFPFFDDFEDGLVKWEVSGRDWALITSDYRSENHSITDSPEANYASRSFCAVTLKHPINLSTTSSPILSFWHKRFLFYSTSTSHDDVWVDLSQDGGLSWKNIYEIYNTSSSWTQTRIDLNDYKETPILIRFRLGGYTGGKDGWYVDDVAIYDSQAPIMTMSTLSNMSSTNNRVYNLAGVVDTSNGVKGLTINGADVPLHEAAFSYALLLEQGSNIITSIVTDGAGLRTFDSRTLTYDDSLPELAITEPADNSTTHNAEITLSGTTASGATVTYMLNEGDVQAVTFSGTTFSFPITLSAGLNTIEVTATEGQGLSNTLKRTVYYDPQQLSLSIIAPVQDSLVGQAIYLLKGNVADRSGSAAVTIVANNQTYTLTTADGRFEQQIPLLADVINTVGVAVVDENNGRAYAVRNIYRGADSTAGDCDGDDDTTIAEVQGAINMYLGLKASESCVDVDESGDVSIVEVQAVINGYLGL